MEQEIKQLKEEEQRFGDPLVEASDCSVTRSENSVAWGVGLILVGVVFLLAQIADFHFNWWALFILWPAVTGFLDIGRKYRSKGYLTTAERQGLPWSMMFLVVAVFFLFDLSWRNWWPVILIVGGVSALGVELLAMGSRSEA